MNWKNTISDLQKAGLTQVQIAQVCGCTQSTVSELLNDESKVPRYPVGVALLELHKKTMRRVAKNQAEA